MNEKRVKGERGKAAMEEIKRLTEEAEASFAPFHPSITDIGDQVRDTLNESVEGNWRTTEEAEFIFHLWQKRYGA